jgi:hypothetical protein
MKYSNELVKRYETLQEQVKQLEKEISELKKQFIASGSGESEDYLIVIKDNFRETVAGKADFETKFGSNWLKDNGLLKLSAFNTVVVGLKSQKKAA